MGRFHPAGGKALHVFRGEKRGWGRVFVATGCGGFHEKLSDWRAGSCIGARATLMTSRPAEFRSDGASPSGKAVDFDSTMRRFESSRPSQQHFEFRAGGALLLRGATGLTTFKSNRHHGRACPGKAPPTLLRCKEPARVECVTALGGSGGVCHGQPDYRSSKSRP